MIRTKSSDIVLVLSICSLVLIALSLSPRFFGSIGQSADPTRLDNTPEPARESQAELSRTPEAPVAVATADIEERPTPDLLATEWTISLQATVDAHRRNGENVIDSRYITPPPTPTEFPTALPQDTELVTLDGAFSIVFPAGWYVYSRLVTVENLRYLYVGQSVDWKEDLDFSKDSIVYVEIYQVVNGVSIEDIVAQSRIIQTKDALPESKGLSPTREVQLRGTTLFEYDVLDGYTGTNSIFMLDKEYYVILSRRPSSRFSSNSLTEKILLSIKRLK